MGTGEKIGSAIAILVLLVILSFIGWIVWDTVQLNMANTTASDQCWECGWGRYRIIDSRYFCIGWEDDAEVARPVKWVQENACQ